MSTKIISRLNKYYSSLPPSVRMIIIFTPIALLLILITVVLTLSFVHHDTLQKVAMSPVEPTIVPGSLKAVNVSFYGAKCDGVTDDTAAIQAAIQAAPTSTISNTITADPGSVCLFSRLIIDNPVVINFSNATLKIKQGSQEPFIRVNAENVTIYNTIIDGNQTSGVSGWLIKWYGENGQFLNSTVQNGNGIGLSVESGTVRVRYSTAKNFTGIGIGFRQGNGRLETLNTHAQDCSYAGFYFAKGGTGGELDGTTTHNGTGAILQSNNGRIRRFIANDDNNFGLKLENGASNWVAGYIETNNIGKTIGNRSGTGVELWNDAVNNRFDTILSNANAGYAVALGLNNSGNTFGTISADQAGAIDGDPGVVLAKGNNNNSFTSIIVKNHTLGLRLGEDDFALPISNNNNQFGRVTISNANYNGIRFERGSNNKIDAVTLTDTDSSGSNVNNFRGAINFTNDSSDNIIGRVDESANKFIPDYVVYVGTNNSPHAQNPATATRNRINGGTVLNWTIKPYLDAVGGNIFSFAIPAAPVIFSTPAPTRRPTVTPTKKPPTPTPSKKPTPTINKNTKINPNSYR